MEQNSHVKCIVRNNILHICCIFFTFVTTVFGLAVAFSTHEFRIGFFNVTKIYNFDNLFYIFCGLLGLQIISELVLFFYRNEHISLTEISKDRVLPIFVLGIMNILVLILTLVNMGEYSIFFGYDSINLTPFGITYLVINSVVGFLNVIYIVFKLIRRNK
jgi:hypothetical protein